MDHGVARDWRVGVEIGGCFGSSDLRHFVLSIGRIAFLLQGGRWSGREGSVPEHLVDIGRSLSLPERDR
jgi:hypothetical protein